LAFLTQYKPYPPYTQGVEIGGIWGGVRDEGVEMGGIRGGVRDQGQRWVGLGIWKSESNYSPWISCSAMRAISFLLQMHCIH